MIKLFRNVAAILTLILLNSFSLFAHASAMPMTVHDMGNTEHQNSSTANCVTLCRTAVLTKDEELNQISEEQDDEPTTPYYAQFQTSGFNKVDVKSKLYAVSVKPPPKVPIYILYAVFRV